MYVRTYVRTSVRTYVCMYVMYVCYVCMYVCMLCYVMLCYVKLCNAMLCYAMLCYACMYSLEPGGNAKWQWSQVGWILADHRDGLSSSSFIAWSSIAQSVCQQAFSLLKIGFQRPSRFESCILQRNTSCLLSIQKSLASAKASKLTTKICISPEPGANAKWQWGQVG